MRGHDVPRSEIVRIGVYCGASAGTAPRFAEIARALGDRLARNDFGIVYGGASRGLMEELANAAPIALMDVDGFYQPTLAHLRNSVNNGFLSAERLASLGVCTDVDSLFTFLATSATVPVATLRYAALTANS